MTRRLKTEGIVIKRRNFGETDRMLTLFTKDFGKIQVKATGVRKITSRRAPHIELLNRVELGLYKAQGVPVLINAHVLDDYEQLKKDLGIVGFAYHMSEIIDGLLPENQVHEDIYLLFIMALQDLAKGSSVGKTIQQFEIQLLQILGFGYEKIKSMTLVELNDYIESLLERKLKTRQVIAQIRKNTS